MPTATNPQTGEKLTLQNGQWVPLRSAAPVAPMAAPDTITLGTPQPDLPAPQTPTQAAIDAERLRAIQIANAKADKPAATSATAADVKLQAKRAALTSLETQINRVDDLYRKGFKDEALGVISSLGEYLPTDKAAALNTAGAGLAEQGLAAFRVPGVGSQSDTELRQFVEANRPSSWDRDVAVEEKLRQLRARVDATRAEMGLPPAQWAASPEETPKAPSGTGPVVHDANLGGEQLTASTNGTRTVDNPKLEGVRGEYLARLERGDSATDILAYLRKAGITDPKILRSTVEQIRFRRANPNVPIDKYNTSVLDDMDVPLSSTESALNNAAQTAPGAYAMRAGNAVTADNLDSIVGALGGNAERTRLSLDAAGQAHPYASLAGDLSGGTLAAMSGEAGLARAGMAPGLGRALVADTAYGSAAGAGASDGGNRINGALLGGLAGFGGSLAGNALSKGVGNAFRGVSDPSVNALVQNGTPLTFGQAVGRSGRVGQAIKGIEDRVAGLPVVGDMINTRRAEGIRAMNAKAFDKALEPISATVGDKVGEEGVQEAQAAVQKAFGDALKGKAAQLDSEFVSSAQPALSRLLKIKRNGLGKEIVDQIEEATRGYVDPQTGLLTGENMQAMLGSLRQIRQAYRNDPLGHRIAHEVRRVESAVEGMFERQAPEVMPEYNNAKKAYRRLSVLADAVNRGKNSEGVFTPGQLGMSDRANSVKFDGKIGAASGNSPFHDFQRAAQDVLPNRVPDSGTAGRYATLAVPGLIAGSGAGVGYAAGDTQGGASAGLGLATILAALYTKRGQAALVALAAKRNPAAKAAGAAIQRKARLVGRAAGAQAALNSGD